MGKKEFPKDLRIFLPKLDTKATKLQDASRPIQRDILMLAELKDELGFYQGLDTKHGIEHVTTYSERYDVFNVAVVRKADVDQKSMFLQKELDDLYSKVDAFNTAHHIESEDITAEMLAEIVAKPTVKGDQLPIPAE